MSSRRARTVRLGQSVSLARPIETEAAADNPEPAHHDMTGARGDHHIERGLDFALDRFAMNVHGNANSHIDALCHVVFDSKLYNEVPVDVLTSSGATSLSIDLIHDGIIGRGVLLDIPRLRGLPWLEPGDHVTDADLREAEEAQHVLVGQGDLLFVRVGHMAGESSSALGMWRTNEPACIRARSNSSPSERSPCWVRRQQRRRAQHDRRRRLSGARVAMNALGIHLLDYLQFDELTPLCEQHDRWTFLAVIAPLRLPAATGSPINPIAIL